MDISHKWLWSRTGSHKVSLKSVCLKKLSNMSFLVEVNRCIAMYPPMWTEPLTCRLQMRTCNQLSSSHSYLLPPRGVSVPCTESRPTPTALHSCPSAKKNKQCWGSFDLADSLWNAVRQQRWAISLLPESINCQSSLHDTLSRVLLRVCPAPPWDIWDHQGSGWSVHLWQLDIPFTTCATHCWRPAKWDWFYLELKWVWWHKKLFQKILPVDE